MSHKLPDCMLTYYSDLFVEPVDSWFKHDNEICEQGWADLKWDGINWNVAKKMRKNK